MSGEVTGVEADARAGCAESENVFAGSVEDIAAFLLLVCRCARASSGSTRTSSGVTPPPDPLEAGRLVVELFVSALAERPSSPKRGTWGTPFPFMPQKGYRQHRLAL
jgi:hypothetical protein